MAVRPGAKFVYGDLSPLLAAANGKVAHNYDLSGFYNVSPMYTDPNGNNYGYRQCGSFAIQNQGTSYKVGDTVVMPNVTFEVCMVDAAGKLIGLMVTSNNGFAPGSSGVGWETANDPSSPQNLTGGSGTGASVTFTVGHVGPTSAYAMPDRATTFTQGRITNLLLNAGGTGYHVGDVLTPPELVFTGGSATVTVNTVDGSGKILTFTVNGGVIIPNGLIPVPQDVAALAVTGGHGTGATFTGLFMLQQRPQWLTELNRMRVNLYNIPDFIHNNDPRQCVSGAWPGGPTANFQDTWFWFAGNSASVNLTSVFQGSTAKFTTQTRQMLVSIPGVGDTITSNGLLLKTLTVSFIVGGNSNLNASGTVYLILLANNGGQKVTLPHGGGSTYFPDNVDPATLVSVGSTNFPAGIAITTCTSQAGTPLAKPYVVVSCTLPASIAPGRYDLTLNVRDPGMDSDVTDPVSFVNTQTRHTVVDVLGSVGNPGTDPSGWLLDARTALAGANTFSTTGGNLQASGNATASISYTNAIPAPGIHNSLPVKKIQVPGDALGNAPGFSGVFQNQVVATSNVSGNYNPGDVALDPNGNTETCTVGGTFQVVGSYGGFEIDQTFQSYEIYPTPDAAGWATNVGGTTIAGAVFQLTAINPLNAPDWRLYPYPQPNFHEQIRYGGITIITSVPGLWTSKCPPVSSLNIVPASAMPWNLNRTKWARNPGSGVVTAISVNPMLYGDLANTPTTGPSAYQPQVSNSYDQTLTCEEQQEPPPWVANRVFTPDFTILDTNGNTQKAGQYGTSGSTAPGFASTKGSYTWDGGAPGSSTLVWNCIKVFKPATDWQANKNYATNQTVTDSNGNLQTATNSGTTGMSAPSWSTKYNGVTNDGSIVWKLTSPAKTITPAQHRIPDLPRYPNYWFSETIPRMLPPVSSAHLTVFGAYNQWKSVNSNGSGGFDSGWNDSPVVQDPNGLGQAYGWWIYSISLNRTKYPVKTSGQPADAIYGMGGSYPGMGDEGQSGTGMGGPGNDANSGPIIDNSEIAVTIGCIRNGVFVAFGTYNTGQTYQVLWPVFTSDCLVYQASERIDLQPLAIAQNSSVSSGATVSKPMCAANITDTIALIDLLN